MNRKTAYYQSYDPSVLEMSEYCVRQDMCDDIGSLEDIVRKNCECYLEEDDSIDSLDEYDGLEQYDEEDEDEEDEDED